jgi:hypothetical protein
MLRYALAAFYVPGQVCSLVSWRGSRFLGPVWQLSLVCHLARSVEGSCGKNMAGVSALQQPCQLVCF